MPRRLDGCRIQKSHARHTSSLSTMTFSSLSMLLLSLSLSSNIHSARAQGATAASSKNIPVIDYEALGGSLGIVGSFAGVDLYDSTGRSSYVASISSSTSSTSRSHLLWLDQEGTPSILASVQGSINAVVQCSNEAVYFGGSFSSILSSNTPASNMAVYFPANDSITALSSGVDGPVSALACDDTTSTLYVGGSFRAPVGASESAGYDGAVAAWDIKTSTWSPLGFGGFRGNNVEVLSIALNDASSASDRSLLFGGSFQTYWLNESTTTSTSTSVSVTTLANGTLSIKESNTTSSPSSDGNSVTVFPSLGASLIPISLASAEITSSSSTSNTRYSDASNVFCPAGDDGDNDSTWLARDGDQSSRITARLFAPLDVGGFRIGNTRVNGAGTQSFRVTAVPSNEVLTLQYRQDPSSASSALATCSNSCPLSHDSSIPYEDFVIASASNTGRSPMTGFEITLLSHYGSTSGLHLLQLLSSGTTAYAIDTQNEGYGRGICTSGPGSVYGRSSSTHQPTPQVPWDHVEVTSSTIAGTSEGALCAAVPVNEDSNNAPTATWYPYIGQDGTYELYFFTPACAFDATCGQRGAVDVEVAITGSTSASTSTTITTINQEVDQDLSSLIYSGPINPIADSAEVKVTMKLSDTERPALAPGKGDKYYLVADKIVTVAKDTDGNGSDKMKIGTGMNSVNVTTADNTHPLVQYEVGYGLFEWKISDTITISPTLDEALTIPQEMKNIQSASSIDRFAFGFENGAKIDHVLSLPNESGYVLAGEFSTSTSSSSGTLQNIVMVNVDGSLAQNTQRGLNGPITSLILDGQYIYAAGRFTATSDGSLTNLQGRARQTFSSGAWEAVPGVTTNVNSTFIAAASNDKLFIAYSGAPADLWYTTNSSMVNTADRPLVIGNFSSSSLSNDGKGVYLAGSLSALAQSPSSGSAIITKDGLVPINFGFQLASPPSDSNQASATSPAKRTMLPASSLMSTLKNKLRKRQSGNTLPAPSSLPITPFLSPSEPVINAGAHWKNASAKDEEVTILGGRFVSQDGTVTDIGILHADGTFVPLKGDSNATGDVKALYVADNLLFIGRSDSADGALSVYDLAAQQWRTSDIVSAMITTATTSILPSVNVIIGTEDAVIVTGYFENLNNVVGCNGVCEWRKETKAWNALESGVEGVAATMATSKTRLYLGGSFVANNTSAYVMSFEYESMNWTALPAEGMPGPALAISVDSDTSVFAAGVSATDGTSSYLIRWDGEQWSDVRGSAQDQNPLQIASSSVQQLLVAPTTSEVDTDYFSANDRVLLVSGQLNMASSGSASSAIFDGFAWYPFLLSSTAAGAAGTVAGLFYPASAIQFSRHNHLAVGLVILVSMAIALGVVFLGVLIALIITLSKRHEDANAYPPVVIPPYDADYSAREATSPAPFLSGSHEKGKGKMTPTSMLETINAATVALSAGHPGLAAAGAVRMADDGHDSDEHEPSSAGEQHDGTSSGENSIYDDPDEGDDSLPMRAVRYSFDAEREEELSINTRDVVEVLDESDEHWHIVRRMRDGRQGLVPSAFLA